jgi:hypothetical protein
MHGFRSRSQRIIDAKKRQRGSIRMDVNFPLHVRCHFTRRTFLRLMAAAGLLPCVDSRPARAQRQEVAPAYSYPMGFPGHPLGDGLLVRHGYATENTWYNPGWLYRETPTGATRPSVVSDEVMG